MPSKRSTTKETEADLESRIRAAIKVAFPWLPDNAIKHQIKFTFKFGRKTLEVDAGKSRNEARLDILLEMDDKPLAVLELKRPGIELTDDDGAQGLSYARLVEPPAPLVVVTNGTDVRFLVTHTGKPWEPATGLEEAFKALMAQASRVAGADLRHAIDTLMGTTPAVWMQAVRHVSEDTVRELTASWNEPALPFIDDFLTPRGATFQLLRRLEAGKRLLVLEGPPLSGKSNVLRELLVRTAESETMVLLYVEAGVGSGALQTVADALARSLNWPVTSQEARDWLIRVSNNEHARIVLAFDGLQASDALSVKEIEDLSSCAFGPFLSLVVAIDEAVSQSLLTAPNRRSASPLGRRSERVYVGQLLDNEFRVARDILAQRRVYLMTGADLAPEYREPWVLRAIGGFAQAALEDRPEKHGLTIPSLLGLRLIGLVRKRFADDPELRRRFRALAQAMVADAQDPSRPSDLALEQVERGVIRRDAAQTELEPDDLQWLFAHGLVRPDMHEVAGATILIRLPELLASEMARVLADQLESRARRDLHEAAMWIAGAASNLPLGEVVAAQAIVDATTRPGGVPVGIIDHLLETPPKRETLDPHGRYGMLLPGGVVVDITVQPDGKGFFVIEGQQYEIDLGDDEQVTYNDIHPWMILSHVASTPFEVQDKDGSRRRDPDLLLTIGTCPVPLRASRGPQSLRMLPMIDFPGGVSVVHPTAGIVEPITLGILNYISAEEAEADNWIARAATSGSIALLSRVHAALRVLVNFETHERSKWADNILNTVVLPQLRDAIDAADGT
ncbi:type I restriction endonuclease [Burkholderia ubonensis]|uniref:type I restriction endonuclease n=1 Tax=Burkholderia ubonensis TaxID=101571 RepID=UPI00075A6B79|nr:type I restriction endonuclease [Burkholderia ubonensis]KVC72111.1 hypothetical protein WI75_03055 [Burkholderia ubonensis]